MNLDATMNCNFLIFSMYLTHDLEDSRNQYGE